jgi:hypothetical protein
MIDDIVKGLDYVVPGLDCMGQAHLSLIGHNVLSSHFGILPSAYHS